MNHMTKCRETVISKDLMYLFNNGTNYQCYNILGAHKINTEEADGYLFSVWAPNALKVSVTGDFNSWDENADAMELCGDFGIWYRFIPGVKNGERYKF